MLRKGLVIIILSLIMVLNMLTPTLATPRIVELIKPITDIKTINKNMIISGWAAVDTKLDIRVYNRVSQRVEGQEVYTWEEYIQPGKEAELVVGPTGFFAREVELKNGVNKIVIKAVNPEGEEETTEGLVTLSSKEEVREAVKNLMNFNFLDIIKEIIK
jgi:hypothetical protein